MTLRAGSLESSPWWVARGRSSDRQPVRERPAEAAPQFRVRGGAAADLLGGAAAVAAMALVWLLLLGAIAAPAAHLLH